MNFGKLQTQSIFKHKFPGKFKVKSVFSPLKGRCYSIHFENIDAKNPSGNNGITPLHIAVKEGHLEICRLIIENAKDKNPAASAQKGMPTPQYGSLATGHLR